MKSKSLPSSSPAQRLIQFAGELTTASVPTTIMEQAKWCLLDGVGCALFGSTQPWGRIMMEEIVAEHARGPCTILGNEKTVPAPAAALCNGTALHGFELDDLIPAAIVHPGCVILPAALAAAEAADASGDRLLRGIVAGYEATARLSAALGLAPSHRGFHKTAVVGPVAAAIAAGVVNGLSAAQSSAAVGLACSSASGIKSFATGGGGMVKRMHAGRAAEAGVRMSQLARRGFTGPETAIDGRYGLLEAFGGESARSQCLTDGLGEEWALNDVWVKVYPICGWIQGVVQLLLAMRGAKPLTENRIKKVRVGTSKFAVTNNGNSSPSDTMQAQYSIPYCAALALTGNPSDPASFALEAINDPGWRPIAERVELYVDPQSEAVYPAHFGCHVTLHLDTGEVREDSLLDAHGTAADPCSQNERIAKFRRLASAVLSTRAVSAFLQKFELLEQMNSTREFTAILRQH